MNESQDSNDSSANNTNDIRQQEAEHQGAAVKAALGANIGVAIAKLAAAFFTGSSAMLSESVHSIADCFQRNRAHGQAWAFLQAQNGR